MFNWFKKQIFNTNKSTHATIATDSAKDSPAQVELTIKSIAHKESGDYFLNHGEFGKATVCYQQAIACDPNYAEAYNNLGNAYSEQNLIKEAEHCLIKASSLKPDLANIYYNLATLLMEQGRLEEAINYYACTFTRKPEHYAALAMKLNLMQKTCTWAELDTNIKTLRGAVSIYSNYAINVFSPFTFLAFPGSTPSEQKMCAKKWVQFEYPLTITTRNQRALPPRLHSNNKITIGYISADFRQHPVSFLMAEIFELHDRSRFKIVAYAYDNSESSTLRKRLEFAFDDFVDISGNTDEEAANNISADNIDILVDLTGLTKNSRSGILALRPAPIQVNYLGYPGTMGADFVDYLIADQFVIPEDQRECYTEKVVWMPDCFMPNDSTRLRPKPPTRKDCALPESGFVFCCFNQTYKITPEIFDTWCRLLRAVPDSVLWLPSSNSQAEGNLRKEAENRGVASGRIIMAPKLAQIESHLARLQCADLFLDTIPYNAHATCSDALWMGLPVITCVGQTFPSRVAGSLLSAIGLPELITYNLDDYFNLALGLATDSKKLEAIRQKLIFNRDSTPLFDSERFTRNLEKVYIQMMDTLSAPPSSQLTPTSKHV